MMRETRRACACALLSAALLLSGWFVPHASAQERKRKPVVVSFGQPSIWSLEQAHYLLARMHQENLEVRASSLTALDPNETHATRIQLLKQLLEVGAQFDQGVGVQNERIVRNNEFNDNRRRELITRRDSLQGESLDLSREISRLEIERARMNTADPPATAEAKAAKDTEIAKKREEQAAVDKQITFHNGEIGTPSASGTPESLAAPTPSGSPLNSRLPAGLFDAEEFKALLRDEAKDPRLNATTRLDNHVQMQYEIIAKQLTLLRDEVGPGERLVFLELPQSVYTTPGPGDEKMAQAWWHVNGYTKTDPLLRLLLELYEVEQKWRQIQVVPAFAEFANSRPPDGTACNRYATENMKRRESEKNQTAEAQSRVNVLRETFYEFQCEYETARARLIRDLFREARSDFSRAQQGGARDTSEMVQAIREAIGVSALTRNERRDRERNEDAGGEVRRSVDLKQAGLTAEAVRKRRDALKDKLLCILSDPDRNINNPGNCPDPGGFDLSQEFDFKKGIEYVRMDGRADRGGGEDGAGANDIELRTVRTVDIIPRQSSLNVNDIQSTVKATGILAAFKFLFGFAGQVNFQRQREQFEQFIHQELYASGFGKGNRDFGWTFGALPGTKRVAPGVRTTYAVLVVPDDAESLVLSARGCYFPRKSYQPLDFEDTTHKDWDREGKFRSYNCGDEQTYILPIPGGGDRSNFWVTNVDYIAAADGSRATVSIRGKNFSTQMGVLVNGVPLWPAVGLAQPLLGARARTDANEQEAKIRGLTLPKQTCGGDQSAGQNANTKLCGDYERIDPGQIVISFTMPTGFSGIPTITLVAPGKAVDINTLPNLTVNGVRNTRLADADFVFGARPQPRIADFRVFLVSPNSRDAYALLTGDGFDAADEVYVNGELLEPKSAQNAKKYREYKSPKLYRLMFPLPPGDKVYVTVRKDDSAPVTKEFANPLQPKKDDKPPGGGGKPPGDEGQPPGS